MIDGRGLVEERKVSFYVSTSITSVDGTWPLLITREIPLDQMQKRRPIYGYIFFCSTTTKHAKGTLLFLLTRGLVSLRSKRIIRCDGPYRASLAL